MPFHDPRKAAELVRNHLATHDTPISFLFGAGTSACINIAPKAPANTKPTYTPLVPAVELLTTQCCEAVKKLGKSFTKAWDALIPECDALHQHPNIENILSRIRSKIDALGDGDKPLGLSKDHLNQLEACIRKEIARCASPQDSLIPKSLPHDLFALWVKQTTRHIPVEVFTTNYDILLERSLERANVPVFDGFAGSYEPYFNTECVDDESLMPGPGWVRLWKLHGSVNWHISETNDTKRVLRKEVSPAGEMILPSHRKYDESRKQPYLALIDRLGKALARDGALLVTCGFSFSDQHINALLYGVLDNRPLSHVLCFQFSTLEVDDPLVRASSVRPNFLLFGPNAAVINGTWGEWRLREPVDNTTYPFLDVFFDSDGEPDTNKRATTGRMRLGDFNWLGRFLRDMGPSHEGLG